MNLEQKISTKKLIEITWNEFGKGHLIRYIGQQNDLYSMKNDILKLWPHTIFDSSIINQIPKWTSFQNILNAQKEKNMLNFHRSGWAIEYTLNTSIIDLFVAEKKQPFNAKNKCLIHNEP